MTDGRLDGPLRTCGPGGGDSRAGTTAVKTWVRGFARNQPNEPGIRHRGAAVLAEHVGRASCSAIAGGFDRFVVHLANHDVTLCTTSRAPMAKLPTHQQRMGWSFRGRRRSAATSTTTSKRRQGGATVV